MKALRLEKKLLFINLISVVISIILAYISCYILHSLSHVIISIIIVLMLRCIIAEVILKNYINIKVLKNIMYEIILTTVFIIGSWYFQNLYGVLIYFIAYLVFIGFNIKYIIKLTYKL